MSIRALICEDEPLARETLRDFIAASPDLLLVGEATNGREGLTLIRALAPDLVFMDIQMPELTGLEVVRELLAAGEPMPPLIFTTAYDQHAVAAFELQALDYLLKPFTAARFDAAVKRALTTSAATAERGAAAVAALGGGLGAPLSRILVRDRGIGSRRALVREGHGRDGLIRIVEDRNRLHGDIPADPALTCRVDGAPG